MRLGTYLLAGFALVAALPVALLLGINEISIRDHTQTEIGRISGSVAYTTADSVSMLLAPVISELKEIALAYDDPQFAGDYETLLSIKSKSLPFLESLLVIDPEGFSSMAAPKNPSYIGHDFSGTMLFKYPRDYGQPYFTDSFLSSRTKMATAAVSVASKSGVVVSGNLNLERVFDLVVNATRTLGATVRVLDSRGTVIAGPDRSEVSARKSFRELVRAAMDSNWGESEGFAYTREGRSFIAFSSPIANSPWRTLVSFNKDELEALSAFIRERVILGGLAALALSFLAAYFLARGINRPLENLLAKARAVARENYSQDCQTGSLFAEMDDLLQEFANMQREIALREEELKGALAGRETLLKEIHHRVKNNLQIVASLLALQRERIENPEAYTALSESAHRVQSLSLVHEKLYQSSDFSTLDLGEYLDDFCRGLLATFDAGRNIDYSMEKELVEVDIDIAIPLGLCVNELLSNSIKYGSPPDGRRGAIRLALERSGEGFVLEISDSGPGFDLEKARKSGSLGLVLLDSLVAQVKGGLSVDFSSGSRFTIRVPRTRSRG